MNEDPKVCRKSGKALSPRSKEERDALTDDDRKELEAIPYTDVQFSHIISAGRSQREAKRDSYQASIRFDKFHCALGVKLDKDGNQYALAYLPDARSAYIPNQFTAQRRVRLVKVHYPANGSLAEADHLYCELFAAPGLVFTVRLDDGSHDDFLLLLDSMRSTDPAFGRKWFWFVRQADQAEKPVEPEAEDDK